MPGKPGRVKYTAAALALAGLIAITAGLWELSGRGPVNPALPAAEAAAKEIAVAATVAYASLRAIDMALSFVQEVELSPSAAGFAAGSLHPLKFLEPIDDTVERVADALFALVAAAALLTVGFAPVAALGLTLLGLGLLALAAGVSRPSLAPATRFGRSAARIGAAFGLVLPLGFVLGVELGAWLTEPHMREARAQLTAVADEARTVAGATAAAGDPETAEPSDPQGLLERMRAPLEAVGKGFGDMAGAVGRYSKAAWVIVRAADDLLWAMLVMIAVFVLRTLLLPLLLFWGFMALLRHAVLPQAGGDAGGDGGRDVPAPPGVGPPVSAGALRIGRDAETGDPGRPQDGEGNGKT